MLRDLVSRVRNRTFLGKIRDQPPRIWIFGPSLLHWWSLLLMRIKLPTHLFWISKYTVLEMNGFYSTKVKITQHIWDMVNTLIGKVCFPKWSFPNLRYIKHPFLLLLVNISLVIFWIFNSRPIEWDSLERETNIFPFLKIWFRKCSSFLWFLS